MNPGFWDDLPRNQAVVLLKYPIVQKIQAQLICQVDGKRTIHRKKMIPKLNNPVRDSHPQKIEHLKRSAKETIVDMEQIDPFAIHT
ncbi:hypothetical protein J437_LFUL012682 [Ladona fulva]|uniref:Uncharacterized protein n=1 Tax=Ladona fulva TaxID=123851 RepID=A0A8K0P6M1_LADFU|nr:hypothetical protein J437_LFUL012682 [Ladona fulva]